MSDNGIASKNMLFSVATARRFDQFRVPGFEAAGLFRIRSLTELERSRYEALALDAKGSLTKDRLMQVRRRLIVLCLVDKEGNPILSEADMSELETLDSALTGYIYDRCVKHCGFGETDIEELVKNSETIHVE